MSAGVRARSSYHSQSCLSSLLLDLRTAKALANDNADSWTCPVELTTPTHGFRLSFETRKALANDNAEGVAEQSPGLRFGNPGIRRTIFLVQP